MLQSAKYSLELFNDDEFKVFIVEGDNGYGKSTYSNKTIAECYNKNGVRNWDTNWLFPGHLGYHPYEVQWKWKRKPKNRKDKIFHWDDAASWLNKLKAHERLVRDVCVYLQTARSDWGVIIFSCIDKEDLAKAIREYRNAVIVTITKNSDNSDAFHKNRRVATARVFYKNARGQQRYDTLWEEEFDARVPGNYCIDSPEIVKYPSKAQMRDPNITWGFYGWYKPLRDTYTELAKRMMERGIQRNEELNQIISGLRLRDTDTLTAFAERLADYIKT